jgi:hypothetical protein
MELGWLVKDDCKKRGECTIISMEIAMVMSATVVDTVQICHKAYHMH